MSSFPEHVYERPIDPVRGTSDRPPREFAVIAELSRRLFDRFALAGYEPMSTPVLEYTELHERKSGAAIVSKLYELAFDHQSDARLCLRPELTASVVRAYAAISDAPRVPWRVSTSGPVFRYETPTAGVLREFEQAGVELLGAAGAAADGEIIALADWSLAATGLKDAKIRIGHVGLIQEVFERSGLPRSARSTLIEMLADAAGSGDNVEALETGLNQLLIRLESGEGASDPAARSEGDSSPDASTSGTESAGASVPDAESEIDRLFRTLVPEVSGRRSATEVLDRMRRKWELARTLSGGVSNLRERIRELAAIKGSAHHALSLLKKRLGESASNSIAEIEGIVSATIAHGVDADRIELDLGFGRGIGFYSGMIFDVVAATTEGKVEVCGGGRYDGLARVLGSDRDASGVGFALGLERLAHVLNLQGQKREHNAIDRSATLVVAASAGMTIEAIRHARRLRDAGSRAIACHEPIGSVAAAVNRAREHRAGSLAYVSGPIDAAGSILEQKIENL